MKKIIFEISSCSKCPLLRNSSQLHNDPFIDAPYPVKYYCGDRNLEFLPNVNIIDKGCNLVDA